MAVLTPRGGANLTQVVQAALNAAGPAHVRIVTRGTQQGVELPDEHAPAVEKALGWHQGDRDAQPERRTAAAEDSDNGDSGDDTSSAGAGDTERRTTSRRRATKKTTSSRRTAAARRDEE